MQLTCVVDECSNDAQACSDVAPPAGAPEAMIVEQPTCATHARLVVWWNALDDGGRKALLDGDYEAVDAEVLAKALGSQPFTSLDGTGRLVVDSVELDGFQHWLRGLRA